MRVISRSVIASNKYPIPRNFFSNYQHRSWEVDGMTQVFVPAGPFDMGKNEDKTSDHAPEHEVTLNDYWIDTYEVTNAQYELCARSSGCSSPDSVNWMYGIWIFDQYPVVYVTWEQALEYCIWAGKDLPTEAEWEKAARGLDDLKFPWGNEKPTSSLANFGNGIGNLVAAQSYASGASPYGAVNMAGNAREWVRDWFNPTYYQRSPEIDPAGSPQGAAKSLRGGGFNDPIDRLMGYNRFSHDPESPGSNRGFRCVSR